MRNCSINLLEAKNEHVFVLNQMNVVCWLHRITGTLEHYHNTANQIVIKSAQKKFSIFN